MVEMRFQELDGERVRYNGDTWAFTGAVDVKRNGEIILANAKKTDRVRGSKGVLRFTLQNPTSSLNPGNLGKVDVSLQLQDDGQYLVVTRSHTTNRYKLDSMTYS